MEKESNKKSNNDCVFKENEKDTNLVDFFDLLLRVDKRNNPELYQVEEENKSL